VLLDLLAKMLERLAYLHDELNIIHRDLHFDQWFVQEDGSVILTDFTTALILGEGGSVPAGSGFNFTPICFSPEQNLQRFKSYSFNSDLWMIGCWFS